jgi:hypothetical protein
MYGMFLLSRTWSGQRLPNYTVNGYAGPSYTYTRGAARLPPMMAAIGSSFCRPVRVAL